MNPESRAGAAGPPVKAARGSRTEWAVTEQSGLTLHKHCSQFTLEAKAFLCSLVFIFAFRRKIEP